MRYILACVFGSPIREYHQDLVGEIAARFALTRTQRQAIPAHFTLKYWFTAPGGDTVERVLDDFARTHARASVGVGGFGHFERDVVFVDVQLSDPARRVYRELIATLRALPWMSWERHDAENLHPHMTVAEECGARFDEVWAFARTRERRFTAELANVTIFTEDGERDGVPVCSVQRTFGLR